MKKNVNRHILKIYLPFEFLFFGKHFNLFLDNKDKISNTSFLESLNLHQDLLKDFFIRFKKFYEENPKLSTLFSIDNLSISNNKFCLAFNIKIYSKNEFIIHDLKLWFTHFIIWYISFMYSPVLYATPSFHQRDKLTEFYYWYDVDAKLVWYNFCNYKKYVDQKLYFKRLYHAECYSSFYSCIFNGRIYTPHNNDFYFTRNKNHLNNLRLCITGNVKKTNYRFFNKNLKEPPFTKIYNNYYLSYYLIGKNKVESLKTWYYNYFVYLKDKHIKFIYYLIRSHNFLDKENEDLSNHIFDFSNYLKKDSSLTLKVLKVWYDLFLSNLRDISKKDMIKKSFYDDNLFQEGSICSYYFYLHGSYFEVLDYFDMDIDSYLINHMNMLEYDNVRYKYYGYFDNYSLLSNDAGYPKISFDNLKDEEINSEFLNSYVFNSEFKNSSSSFYYNDREPLNNFLRLNNELSLLNSYWVKINKVERVINMKIKINIPITKLHNNKKYYYECFFLLYESNLYPYFHDKKLVFDAQAKHFSHFFW